ncbi:MULTISPECIES: GGIII-like transmembrane region-containing protein [Acinetobacter]
MDLYLIGIILLLILAIIIVISMIKEKRNDPFR